MPFKANNAFYYYENLAAAADFYSRVLGFQRVADYGYAQIFRVAPTSFLTLVDSAKGMHSSAEPKTVTLALVTNEVEAWYAYLTAQNVSIQHAISPKAGKSHDGFVAVDPEGYFLEFERFNPHPENERLLPRISQIRPLAAPAGQQTSRPPELTVSATVLWLYYQDVPRIERFFEDAFGLSCIVDQGFAKIYPTSPTGFIGPVLAGEGLHPYSAEKGVTVSLWTDDLDGWFTRLKDRPDFRLRTPQIKRENPRFDAFVGYDPEGYFIELNQFHPHEDNQQLLSTFLK